MTAPIMIPAWIDGELTPVEKLEAHQRGLRHKAISVFLLDGDRTLIQKRAAGKYHTPGLWANACCTHPDWNEASDACAVRRLREEIGLIGVSLKYADQVEYRADVGGGLIEHEVVDIFRARGSIASTRFDLNPDEVEAVRWVPLAELDREIAETPEAFTPWLRIYMAEHRERILGELTPA
ncbi:MAG: isopentenyl-diphosphate Delta-isomerase [Pseudomonadota bacterium]